jgi:hypothetical protein
VGSVVSVQLLYGCWLVIVSVVLGQMNHIWTWIMEERMGWAWVIMFDLRIGGPWSSVLRLDGASFFFFGDCV